VGSEALNSLERVTDHEFAIRDIVGKDLIHHIWNCIIILAVRMLDTTEQGTTSTTAAALAHQRDKFDIYSNSWGYATNGSSTVGLTDAATDAIETGIQLV